MEASAVIRFAETAEEREAIFRQRYRIYVEEMGVYGARADHARKQLSDANDATGRLLYASLGDEVIASIRVHAGALAPFPEAFVTVYDLERFTPAVPRTEMAVVTRFLVDARHRSSSISFRLMVACYEFLINQGIHTIFLACAPHLINLYLALGFRTYTHNFNDPDVGFVVPMVLLGRDTGYLKKIRSPLLSKAIPATPAASAAGSAGPAPQLDSVVQSAVSHEQEYWSQVFGLLCEQSDGRHGILDGLSDEQTHVLLSKGHLIECSKGELIIKKGATSAGMFIIMSGTVEVRDFDRLLATLGTGDILGEMAFLLATPRSADVYAASENVRILSADERTLRELVETDPGTAARFLLNLSKSLCLRLLATQARSAVAQTEAVPGDGNEWR